MSAPKVCQPYTEGNPLPVAAHQHPNPDGTVGGWVSETALVASDVHVGPTATIESGAIWGGTIMGGTIRGGTIRGGTIWGGTIRGGTIWGGTIEGGALIRSTRDLLVIGPIGSEDQTLTLHRTEQDYDTGGHALHVGCWTGGTIGHLADEVQTRAPGHTDEYAEAEAMCRRRIAEWTDRPASSPGGEA